MKWVTLISFIFLFSSATSRNLQRVARDAGKKGLINCPYGLCYIDLMTAMQFREQISQAWSKEGKEKKIKKKRKVIDLKRNWIKKSWGDG